MLKIVNLSGLFEYRRPVVDDGRKTESGVGLCATCRHSQRVTSSRGADFLLCGRAAFDPTFSKYPRLPVVMCPGYELVSDGRAPGK